MKQRLDQVLVVHRLVATRSQAENYIKLGYVKVGRNVVTKPGSVVDQDAAIEVTAPQQYVSRAALKLASVAETLQLEFKDKVVLDVGSSTGGFTDYALKRGARKVIAVDVGTNQLHPSLRVNPKVELHEQTDIRHFRFPMSAITNSGIHIILVDVSFISLREILPHLSKLMSQDSLLAAMVKPQFEAGERLKNKGVIKNEAMRREVLKQLESWIQNLFVIVNKADSKVHGAQGNRERFYLLKKRAK